MRDSPARLRTRRLAFVSGLAVLVIAILVLSGWLYYLTAESPAYRQCVAAVAQLTEGNGQGEAISLLQLEGIPFATLDGPRDSRITGAPIPGDADLVVEARCPYRFRYPPGRPGWSQNLVEYYLRSARLRLMGYEESKFLIGFRQDRLVGVWEANCLHESGDVTACEPWSAIRAD